MQFSRWPDKIALFVGPEGDFTQEEKMRLMMDGCVAVSLGPNRLRVETAAVALVSAVQLLLFDDSTN